MDKDKNSELVEKLLKEDIFNENSKKKMLDESKAEDWAKAIVHFIFRNGPVENIHSRGHLTDEDMKVINKYMLNQMTGLILSMQKGEWFILEQMAQYYLMFGSRWDQADLSHFNNEKSLIIKSLNELLVKHPELLEQFERISKE